MKIIGSTDTKWSLQQNTCLNEWIWNTVDASIMFPKAYHFNWFTFEITVELSKSFEIARNAFKSNEFNDSVRLYEIWCFLFVHIQRNLKLKIRPSTKMPHAINVKSFDDFGATNCHMGHVHTPLIHPAESVLGSEMHFIRSLSHILVTLFRDFAVAFFSLFLRKYVCACYFVWCFGCLILTWCCFMQKCAHSKTSTCQTYNRYRMSIKYRI